MQDSLSREQQLLDALQDCVHALQQYERQTADLPIMSAHIRGAHALTEARRLLAEPRQEHYGEQNTFEDAGSLNAACA